MDLVKKNWLSVLLGVIALCAVAADFWPMGGRYAALRTEAQARATVNQQLAMLESKARNRPFVNPDSTEPEPLGMFPTAKVIEAGNVAIAKLAEGSKQLQGQIVKLNIHQPLVPGSLPGQSDNKAPLIDFARAYVDALNLSTPQTRANSMPWQVMHAGTPPTDADISREKERVKQEIIDQEKNTDLNGNITNQNIIDADVAIAQAQLPEKMRRGTAENSMVYIDPLGTFSLFNPQITVEGLPPEPTTIFWAQVGLWIQEDFCRAVYGINTAPKPDGSKPANVMDAPIKRLVKIVVPQTLQQMPFVGLPAPSGDPNAVVPIPADPAPNKALTPTGRVSNGMYDVAQFDVEMDVEADRVPMILEELGRGRFLSVVQVVSITAVDSSVYSASGFYYGNKPVVNLRLKCEDLFLREWTSPLMPPAVQKRLGVTPPPAPA